jgi:PBP1b-binding outer membrane lipoprotein LpoB
MVSIKGWCSIWISVLLLAGCAASPKQELAAASSPPAASGSPAGTVTPPSAGLPATQVEAPPNAVVDLAKQSPNEAENTGQVCKQMLKPNTNSIITVCGTPAQWKEFKAAEARQAEQLLLNMQAGRH